MRIASKNLFSLWPKIQWLLIANALIIFSLGLLMIFSTTSAEILDLFLQKSTHQALIKQFFYACGGMFFAYLMNRVGYIKLIELSPLILIFLTVLLFLVLCPGIGKEVNGSKRWIHLMGLSFQPSEFVKMIAPAYFIHAYQSIEKPISLKPFLKILGKLCFPIFMIMIEPNNGTTVVIIMTLLVVFFLMEVPFKYWALPLLITSVIGIVFASQLPYVKGRMNSYMHPELDLKGKGHQPFQAKIAAGSGGFWGRGPGNSLQKMSYLPESQNDYIAAIYAEEWGFFGILVLIGLYLLLALLAFTIAMNSETQSGLCFGGAIAFLITFQAFLNMGVVSGLLPSTGLNLPFFSQGGSSLMANIMGLGIILSIAKS